MIDRIEKIRTSRGWSQAELEQRAALAVNRISKWVKGQGEPTARQALKIARELNVPLEWLCDDDAPEEPEQPAGWPSEAERMILRLAHQVGLIEAAARLAKSPNLDVTIDRPQSVQKHTRGA